jgi:hypothetical protein
MAALDALNMPLLDTVGEQSEGKHTSGAFVSFDELMTRVDESADTGRNVMNTALERKAGLGVVVAVLFLDSVLLSCIVRSSTLCVLNMTNMIIHCASSWL